MERSPRTSVANSSHVLSQTGREGMSVDGNREPQQTERREMQRGSRKREAKSQDRDIKTDQESLLGTLMIS